MEIRLPVLDQAVSALIEDVSRPGHGPRDARRRHGRDGPHAPALQLQRPARPRALVGRDVGPDGRRRHADGPGHRRRPPAKGEEPKDRRLHPNDVLATWYATSGSTPSRTFARPRRPPHPAPAPAASRSASSPESRVNGVTARETSRNRHPTARVLHINTSRASLRTGPGTIASLFRTSLSPLAHSRRSKVVRGRHWGLTRASE